MSELETFFSATISVSPWLLMKLATLYALTAVPLMGYLSLCFDNFDYVECWKEGANIHLFQILPPILLGGALITILIWSVEAGGPVG